MNKLRFYLVIIALSMITAFHNPILINAKNINDNKIVLAYSWTPSNGGIYSGSGPSANNSEVEDKEPGFTEKAFSELLRALANGLLMLFNELNIDLDTIIYGRVLGHTSINQFSFELKNGNTYGVVGAFGYSILRSIVLTCMTFTALFIYLKAAWSSGVGQAGEKIKTQLDTYIIAYLLLFLMPRFVEIGLYLRDILLYGIGTAATKNSLINGSSANIIEQYKVLSETTKKLLPSAMYLSSVLLSVYFVIIYVFTAVSMMIAFMFFPLISLLSCIDNKLIGNWIKMMFSTAMIPVIDGMLLLVPLFGFALGSPSLVVFCMCMAIIPARGTVRSLLGINNSLGGELLGLGAMMMAGRLVSGGINTAKNIRQSNQDIKQDSQKADMYEELAKNPVSSEVGELNSTTITNGNASFNRGTSFIPENRQKILAQYATVDNFEGNEFKGVLGDAEMASFYKERANRASKKTTGAIFGGAAGVGVALAGTMFASPSTKLAMASMGGVVGAEVGSHAPQIAQATGVLLDYASGTYHGVKNKLFPNENGANDTVNSQMEANTYNDILNMELPEIDLSNIEFDEPVSMSNPNTTSELQKDFTTEQYRVAIDYINQTNDTLSSRVKDLMNNYVSKTGNQPHTSAYDHELLRVNANERANLLGEQLRTMNPEGNVLKEIEMCFNVLENRTQVSELYDTYDI